MAKNLQRLSQLDPGGVIKHVHDELGRSLRISDANSQVPSGFSKVSLTTNAQGSVTEAVFYVGTSAEKTRIKFIDDVAQSLNNKYFYLYNADDEPEIYVWYNVDGNGTDPAISGKCGIEIPISENDPASIVTLATKKYLQASDYFDVETNGDVVLLVNNRQLGDASNSTDVNTGFTVTTSTDGVTERLKCIQLPEEEGVRYIFNHAEGKFVITPDIKGQVTIEGLENGQNIELPVNDSSWTAVTVTVPADKETIAINIQNTDIANQVKLSFQNIEDKGMIIYPNGGERRYVVKKTLTYYLKSVSGNVTLNIEVLD